MKEKGGRRRQGQEEEGTRREKKEEEGRRISNLLDSFHLHRGERQTKNESVSHCGSQIMNLKFTASICWLPLHGIRAKNGGSKKNKNRIFHLGEWSATKMNLKSRLA